MLEEKLYSIPGYEYYYAITKSGRIYSLRYNKWLNPTIHPKGFRAFSATISRKVKTLFIHRLLAEIFIPNPNNYLEVYHLDGNILNNELSNLKWASRSQIILNGSKNGTKNLRTRKIRCIETAQTFNSIKEAALYSNTSASNISHALRNNYKVSGFRYEYIKDSINVFSSGAPDNE